MKYKKKILISVIFVILAIIVSYGVESYQSMSKINDKVIRLHVIANSDSLEDQQLKYEVRNEIINSFNKKFETITSKDESQNIIINNINEIRNMAEETIKSQGYDYDVNVYYGNFKFPRKQYEEIVLPEGSYDAVRIEIGLAQGKNWWCVMFPPLCFVDFGSTNNGKSSFDVNIERKLEEVLTKDEIESIKTKRGLEDIKLKSKIFELIEKGKIENSGLYSNYKDKIYAYSLFVK